MESFYFFKVDSWSFLKQNFMLKRQIGGRWYLPWVVGLGAHLGREQVCFQGSVENLRTSVICFLVIKRVFKKTQLEGPPYPMAGPRGAGPCSDRPPAVSPVGRGRGGKGGLCSRQHSLSFSACYREPPVWASGVCNVKAWSLAQNTFESEPPSPSTVPLAPEKLVKSMDPLPRNRHSGAHFSI